MGEKDDQTKSKKSSKNNGKKDNEYYVDKKSNWIDFNAGRLLSEDSDTVLNDFITLIQRIASGEVKTRNEINGYSEISILKDGVVL